MAQNSSRRKLACRDGRVGMAAKSALCLSRADSRWVWTYSGLPMGVPNTVTPRSAGGVAWPPTQVGGELGGRVGQSAGGCRTHSTIVVLKEPW